MGTMVDTGVSRKLKRTSKCNVEARLSNQAKSLLTSHILRLLNSSRLHSPFHLNVKRELKISGKELTTSTITFKDHCLPVGFAWETGFKIVFEAIMSTLFSWQ